jgi:exopolysaccharide biosynthesis polyprenyl glycosylphosphotransferase
MAGYVAQSKNSRQYYRSGISWQIRSWSRSYLRRAVVIDGICGAVGVSLALTVRFGGDFTPAYAVFSFIFPFLWVLAVSLAGGYDGRYIGVGSEEFRKILNAGVSLTACLAIMSYVVNTELSRTYLVISMPVVIMTDLVARYCLRKWLHRLRGLGRCMSTVVAVGHADAVGSLIRELRRDQYHGMAVTAACVADPGDRREIEGIPVFGSLDDVDTAVRRTAADTVAVLACPELDAVRLRALAWDLEKTGADLCVAPALLDVAGPRTTVRPVAGLTLLHVDHPQLTGPRLVVKELFDRLMAGFALVVLAPVFVGLSLVIRLQDPGPAFFTQIRVGKEGQVFRIFKFRTMVVDAEKRKAELLATNDFDGVLFKMRRDPRVTAVGERLRRWSVDELPQLLNVFRGEMSLVGPRPALPAEAAEYAEHVRRRLVVKPGLTGLWQVNGRSDLSWEESVRLDLRYVENWSFALDLQILWKTISVIFKGSGAY